MSRTGGQSKARVRIAVTAVEGLGAVAVVTLLVALLDGVAPSTGLGVLYLLAVLAMAIRRGERAALGIAVLSVLALNFFFIEPRYRLTIADSENVVALGVFLIAAIVVGRLAETARHRAAEAEDRAQLAASREREATRLARAVEIERGRTDERAAEAEAARRADVLKTTLLQAVSHDLRSPLTAITTAAEGLRAGTLSTEDREALLAAITKESARLARLVEDLLDLSRVEAGAVNPRIDWCDLADVAISAVEQVRASLGPYPIEIDLPAELPLVQADAVQLERVFANLIENAVKFSHDQSAVRISGGAGGGRATVRVTNRGRGIPPSKRSQVFEPFFRGERDAPGSGLGLAISRGFVEANGGRILLQTGAGSDTAFAVSFPIARQPAGVA